MPRFDGTGPIGAGAMTGWGKGNCIEPIRQGAQMIGFGLGLGRGLGRRGGRAGGLARGVSYSDELAMLQQKVVELQKALEQR